MPDHIHMLLSVPPRYSIAMTIGYLKGKSATRIHRELLHTKGQLFRRSFCARGYCVSTVGLDQERVRQYIRDLHDYVPTSRPARPLSPAAYRAGVMLEALPKPPRIA